MKKKIIVTRRWPSAVEAVLKTQYDTILNTDDIPMDKEQIKAALANADAVLTTVTDKLDASVFSDSNIKAGLIGNYGVGFSHIDLDAAKRCGIVVSNTPNVLNECTADIAMTLMLMVARRAGEGERELRSNQWNGWCPTHMVGSKVSGKTLGIVGYGRIGRAMAQRAHHGFGMKIIVHNRSKVSDDALTLTDARQVKDIHELAAESDFISLHCPGGSENEGLINESVISAMKKDAFLINTARGEVIDEPALINALKNEKIAGAGLDVFVNEPNINPSLAKLRNLVMLPHLGSATRQTREAMGFRVIENINQFFNGEGLTDRVI